MKNFLHTEHMFEQNAGAKQKNDAARLSLGAKPHILGTKYEHLKARA